ncbi:MAG: radical SAM protein [Candidatus Omnitrophica bacterium]|nr:radical SAM protein [Candidatus Omnitrophota bacterium]
MSEILLLNQFFTSPKSCPNDYWTFIPLNLLYLANYLKSKGIPSKIYDLGRHRHDRPTIGNDRIRFGVSDEIIAGVIKKEKPKIVGIGCMFSRHYVDILYLTRLIKKINSDIVVVVGGNHATSYVELVLKEPTIDYVVFGEGEITFYELCQALLNGKDFNGISGLAFRDKNNNTVITQKRELIQNLDSLPALDYSFIEMDKYLDDSKISPFFMRYPAFDVISSRGCPGKCVFCTVKNVWGRTWRGRGAKSFVDELEHLNQEYGVKEFNIVDDTASLDQKRWLDICNKIIERKLDIKWTTPNGIAHWTLNEPILKRMKEAGCYRITFGIESGSQKTRQFIGKPHSLDEARSLIRYANRIGMWTICTHIIGFPYESMEEMKDTIRFAKKSGADFSTFYLLSPHVTSDVYKYFRKENLLNFDSVFNADQLDEQAYEKMESALSEEGVDTCHFKKEQLKDIQMKAYRSFIIYRGLSFLFTLRLFYKVRNIEDFLFVFKLFKLGIGIFFRSFIKKNTLTLLYKYD